MLKKLKSSLKWLYPGMRVKRWLILAPLGVLLVLMGVTLLWNVAVIDYLDAFARFIAVQSHGKINIAQARIYLPISIITILLGLLLIFISIRQVIGSITSVVIPHSRDRLVDVMFENVSLGQGQRIVAIGGGTGLSTMLRGLKYYTSNISAIVTVTDDGGSSGRLLNREKGILPPGDIRNCLVALASEEMLMTELFQYRFDADDEGLKGHSFGNLLIVAMTKVTGEFEKAVQETSKVLAIRGNVFPSTTQSVRLRAEMMDGEFVEGECRIVDDPRQIKKVSLVPEDARPLPDALEAIKCADIIVIGPGSVYTSIIPNLLMDEMTEAISKSRAIKVYVCNVMTQPGETDHFRASDHVRAIAEHSKYRIFDYVFLNKQVPSGDLQEKYCRTGAELVTPDVDAIKEMGYIPVMGDFISETDVVRHDPQKLADAIIKLLHENSRVL